MSSNPLSLLNQACFLTGAHDHRHWPTDAGGEVAFAGRSNVGKSSAINVITGHNSLARISKTPGRTQQINFFELPGDRRLVDLPGYGFAKVPEKLRLHWRTAISHYLEERESLRVLVVLMDARRPLQALDQQMVDWCVGCGVPLIVLLTKADKLGRSQQNQALISTRKSLDELENLRIELFSSTKKQGVEVARELIVAALAWPN